jgi:hypothetical protein
MPAKGKPFWLKVHARSPGATFADLAGPPFANETGTLRMIGRMPPGETIPTAFASDLNTS